MIQEHHVEDNSHDLRQRRLGGTGGFFLKFETLAAGADAEHSLGSQANNGTKRLLEAQAAIAEIRRASRRLEPHWLEDQGNRRRRANVVGGDLGSQRHPPAPVPHGVALHSLNEEVTLAGVVVRSGNSQRVEMTALDVLLDTFAVEMCVEKLPQGSSVEQRPGVAPAENCSKGKVHDPRN